MKVDQDRNIRQNVARLKEWENNAGVPKSRISVASHGSSSHRIGETRYERRRPPRPHQGDNTQMGDVKWIVKYGGSIKKNITPKLGESPPRKNFVSTQAGLVNKTSPTGCF